MCGRIRSYFAWMNEGSPLPLRAFRPIISAPQVNFGVTLFIAGMFLRLPVTDGGLIAAARPLQCLIW